MIVPTFHELVLLAKHRRNNQMLAVTRTYWPLIPPSGSSVDALIREVRGVIGIKQIDSNVFEFPNGSALRFAHGSGGVHALLGRSFDVAYIALDVDDSIREEVLRRIITP